ncbi:hypothetical protein JB92DRAFT_866185 [Gautieria morchelliformis]|nr:hypothetical protein JB92DRAFT_866185 [Gautieria morchelliformis]
MSSGSVEDLIVLGGQLQATRYYLVSGLALAFYEYLLTLGDEVRYIWSNRISLAGFLFFLTRYYVLICICKSVGPLQLAYLTVIIIPSNILLLLRVYALYNRNKWILGYLGAVIVIQFAACIFVSTFPGHGPLPMPPIDLPVFQGCLYLPSTSLKSGGVTPVMLELVYDVSIVGLIMAKNWKDRSFNGLMDRGGILRIIVKDGIIYFLIIFSTKVAWLCLALFAPLALKFVNAYPSDVLVSIMINRLTINLHRSVKGDQRISLTPSAVELTAVRFVPAWMINTQDYSSSSSSNIDKAVIGDLGDLALSHESKGIELQKFHPRDDEFNSQL